MKLTQNQKSTLINLLNDKTINKLITNPYEKKDVYLSIFKKLNDVDFIINKVEANELAKLIISFIDDFNKKYPLHEATFWLNISDEILHEFEIKDCLLDVLYNIPNDVISHKIEYMARDVIKFISKLKESEVFISYSCNNPDKIGFLYNNCDWTEFPLNSYIKISCAIFSEAEYFPNYRKTEFNKKSKSEAYKIISNCNMPEWAISEYTSQNIRFFNELLKPIEQ